MAKKFQVDTNGTLMTGLVAYWKFEGNSNDSWGSNNGSDVSMSYGAGYGKVNQGANFNGSSSYINLGNVLGSVFTGAHSVSVWVYVKSVVSNNCGIIAKVKASPNIPCPIDYSILQTTAKIRMMFGDGSNYWWIDTTNALPLNQWNHLVYTYDGSGSFSGMKIYLNNSLCSVNTNDIFRTPADLSYNMNIGARNNGGINFFNGYMDEFGVWSKALSTQEIADLYNSGNGQTLIDVPSNPAFLLNFL